MDTTDKRAVLWGSDSSMILYLVSIFLWIPCWEGFGPLRQTETHFCSPKVISWRSKPWTRLIKKHECYNQLITCEWMKPRMVPLTPLLNLSHCNTVYMYRKSRTFWGKNFRVLNFSAKKFSYFPGVQIGVISVRIIEKSLYCIDWSSTTTDHDFGKNIISSFFHNWD